MKLLFLQSLWGVERFGDFPRMCEITKEMGLDGFGAGARVEPPEMRRLMSEFELVFVPLTATGDYDSFEAAIRKCAEYEPPEIVSHSGRDFMEFDEACRFFEKALKLETEIGVPIAHETHVNTALYAPWMTAKYLEKFPELKLNADFTNWASFCPALFTDMTHWIEQACDRAMHIHTRYTDRFHSLQFSDPRAPEFAEKIEVFEGYWDRILAASAARGREVFYMTQEWCHNDFMNALPYTRQPIVETMDVVRWQNARLKARWKDRYTFA